MLGRAALILTLAGAMLGVAWLLAREFENPSDDLRAGIREALEDAYGRHPGRGIRLDDIVEDDWEYLYVFRPLTPRDKIDRTIAPAELDDSRDLVPADRSFVVLTRGDDVVAAAAVARSPIDVSCVTAGVDHALAPDDQPEVVRTVIRGIPRLAASESGETAARRCLDRLPPATGP